MKKGCLIAAFCTAAAGIVLLTSLFWRPFLFSCLDIALICADQYDSNQVCQVNSTFIIPRTAESPPISMCPRTRSFGTMRNPDITFYRLYVQRIWQMTANSKMSKMSPSPTRRFLDFYAFADNKTYEDADEFHSLNRIICNQAR